MAVADGDVVDANQLEPVKTTADEQQPESTLGEEQLHLTLQHRGQTHSFALPAGATILDLSDAVSETLSIPSSHQKFILSPKPGMLKPPFNSDLSLATLVPKTKITLLGSTPSEISSLNTSIQASKGASQSLASRARSGPVKAATPSRRAPNVASLNSATRYTFLQLRPLPYLPRPERSLRFLERLRDDPGIRAAMVAHRWSVPLLTEMNPAEHTTHESRTLGLNRNGGEVIELRLRTDAYDGYRDYRTIRKTLCHELAHNVHSEHNREFYDLMAQIEKEVQKADWKSGGRTVGAEEFYQPGGEAGDGDFVDDHGAWTGGEFVLGGGDATAGASGRSLGGGGSAVDRREVLARAAEERARKAREQNQQDGGNNGGSSS